MTRSLRGSDAEDEETRLVRQTLERAQRRRTRAVVLERHVDRERLRRGERLLADKAKGLAVRIELTGLESDLELARKEKALKEA